MNLERQARELVRQASEVLLSGGVCVIPTETGYGLAACIDQTDALARIYRIKKRPLEKPLLILLASFSQAPVRHEDVGPCARKVIKGFWPGPLTLLLPARKDLPFPLTGGTGKVGVRISSHPVAQALVRTVGMPVTATSANISGRALPKSMEQVREQLSGEGPDYFLDAGRIEPGPASTIVDVTVEPPSLVRQGAVSLEDILAECGKGPF